MSNYATESYLKDVNTPDFAKKTDLANLKFDIGKLDVDKLKRNVSSNLSNLKSKLDILNVGKLVPVPVKVE